MALASSPKQTVPSFIALLAVIIGGCRAKCVNLYNEAGAPAISNHSQCNVEPALVATAAANSRCDSATLQGRRRYQEDRALCAVDLRIPFSKVKKDPEEVEVSILAVFDGHGGAEASEMASKLFLQYFGIHINFLSRSSLNKQEPEDEFSHLEILKEALIRTINDIDAIFSEVAYRENLDAGSTAVVVLIVDGQVLTANVGDSKALLCSKKSHDDPTHLIPIELTLDHHPDREDEKLRIEVTGGSVLNLYGVPRVNGELAVSRAIGDVYYKRYGVISTPEITNWQPLGTKDRYLVVTSDGIFESLSTKDVCDLIRNGVSKSGSCSSLSDCLVRSAFDKGSMDNLSALVLPLRPRYVPQQKEDDIVEETRSEL